jgi:hypothetical protein
VNLRRSLNPGFCDLVIGLELKTHQSHGKI